MYYASLIHPTVLAPTLLRGMPNHIYVPTPEHGNEVLSLDAHVPTRYLATTPAAPIRNGVRYTQSLYFRDLE